MYIKKGNGDVNQDVPDNMCDMLMSEFQTHRKDEQDSLEKTELMKLVQMRDSETGAEETVYNIVSTLRRKVEEKRFHVNVSSTHMDNLSFHSKTNVQKWKFDLQRWIATRRELGEEALDCKGVMKDDELWRTIIDDVPRYDKQVKELRKVFDRGKLMNFHH